MIRLFLLFFLLLNIFFITEPVQGQTKEIVGWVEWVRIYPGKLKIKAKIDTGAKTSSLNIINHELFQRDGKSWVRFNVSNKKGKTITMEKEVIRDVKIKQKGTVSQVRPVIKLDICLGSIYKEVEVNLVDRSNFNYHMLIGRNFLKNNFVVDPSITFTKKSKFTKNTKCKEPKDK